MNKPRLLIFIVAYHAETTIEKVLCRIPSALRDDYEVDVLVIDDSSTDRTFEESHRAAQNAEFPIRVLFNPVNQGYGGNQKLGYHYAIENGYDFVALLHGDGQYAPECLPYLLGPLQQGEADAVMGSRMITPKGALSGGMPAYKYVGNKILTWIQNRLLHSQLTEFHSGYRIYSVKALKAIPFEYNSQNFHFDTEIIIQLMIAKLRIVELPIPTYYGDEICRVNGLRYAKDVIISTIHARLQELSLFYDRKYDCAPQRLSQYTPKFDFDSPHSYVWRVIPTGSKVVDLGCAGGYVGSALREQKSCFVTGVDAVPMGLTRLDRFYERDLNAGLHGIPIEEHDYVLLLDVIEHLASPEKFLDGLREKLSLNPSAELIISTANIAFLPVRFMLALGQFNYGKRGILDLTHSRLFTAASLTRTLRQAGFYIRQIKPVPAPFPLALGTNFVSRALLWINGLLCRLAPGVFAYQFIVRVQARPTVKSLLRAATEDARRKSELLNLAARAG